MKKDVKIEKFKSDSSLGEWLFFGITVSLAVWGLINLCLVFGGYRIMRPEEVSQIPETYSHIKQLQNDVTFIVNHLSIKDKCRFYSETGRLVYDKYLSTSPENPYIDSKQLITGCEEYLKKLPEGYKIP